MKTIFRIGNEDRQIHIARTPTTATIGPLPLTRTPPLPTTRRSAPATNRATKDNGNKSDAIIDGPPPHPTARPWFPTFPAQLLMPTQSRRPVATTRTPTKHGVADALPSSLAAHNRSRSGATTPTALTATTLTLPPAAACRSGDLAMRCRFAPQEQAQQASWESGASGPRPHGLPDRLHAALPSLPIHSRCKKAREDSQSTICRASHAICISSPRLRHRLTQR